MAKLIRYEYSRYPRTIGSDSVDQVIKWLLDGDVSVQYMAHHYLLGSDEAALSKLQQRIPIEGFGAEFLSHQNDNGHWGLYYYQPKWTSTHYTLVDLKNLFAPDTLKPCKDMVTRMFNECMTAYGGLNLSKHEHPSDICIDGMILNYSSYFCKNEPRLAKLIDHLLSVQRPDGGYTWDINSEKGDPHTTICVLEGFGQYRATGSYRASDIKASESKAVEFLLTNRLFIDYGDKRFLKFSYPYRYRYDLLRVLEYFATYAVQFDNRIQTAIEWLQNKKHSDGLWYLENQHKGNVHFVMEETGMPSRFITIKALYILKHFLS